MPDNDKGHRSTVVILRRSDDKKKFVFRYALDDESGVELTGTSRYVKVIYEGNAADLFDVKGEDTVQVKGEPNIKWKHSKAKKLLYQDIIEGKVPLYARDDNGNTTMATKDIYALRPEFAAYNYDKFPSRLSSLRDTIQKKMSRKGDDEIAFEAFVRYTPVSIKTSRGNIQWKGSEAQELALKDIAEGIHTEKGYRYLHEKRPEYFTNFPFELFRNKIRQEVKTAKYLHTVKVKGKQHQSS